jgi:hypothetical protein
LLFVSIFSTSLHFIDALFREYLMKRLANYLVGVDQGSVVLFSDFEDGGPMWTETGPRAARLNVEFSGIYRKPPTVQVTLTMFDLDQQTNQRADLSAENISTTSFDIVFKTWGDTRVARVRADWLAIGELPHEDDWDLGS